MKLHAVAGICLILFYAMAAKAAEAPHALGGFVLGESIDGYENRLKKDTVMRHRDSRCVMEVDVVPPPGYEGGSINYGTCLAVNKILRVKLKYDDPSPEFYKMLLSRYKQRFGDPDEWKGDPFHVVIAWKWYFRDRERNRISLILQHNSQDEEEKIGNSVKLTLSNEMNAEIKQGRKSHSEDKSTRAKEAKPPDWDQLIPR